MIILIRDGSMKKAAYFLHNKETGEKKQITKAQARKVEETALYSGKIIKYCRACGGKVVQAIIAD